MYFKDMLLSTKTYSAKLFSDYLFYIGGSLLGVFYYLTGLSLAQMQSVLLIIFLDMATRCWAEKKNNRPILSRRMWSGFAGKILSYLILFTFANHAFYLDGIFSYIIFGGFSLVEARSLYENLKDAGQGHLSIIGNRIEKEINKFESDDTSTLNVKENNNEQQGG